jgi:hypothetical protein
MPGIMNIFHFAFAVLSTQKKRHPGIDLGPQSQDVFRAFP